MLLPEPMVPFNELQVHLQGVFCEIPPVPIYILLATPPCTFNVLSVSTIPGVNKVPLVIDLVVNVPVMGQPVIRTPTITDDLTSRSDIFKDDWAQDQPGSVFHKFHHRASTGPLHLHHPKDPGPPSPGVTTSSTSILKTNKMSCLKQYCVT